MFAVLVGNCVVASHRHFSVISTPKDAEHILKHSVHFFLLPVDTRFVVRG